jgi:hypothetical protein
MPVPTRRLTGIAAALLLLLAAPVVAERTGSIDIPVPRLLDSSAVEPGGPDCVANDVQQRPGRRKSRMFGWLWRATRNVDIERTGAPMPFYLRSPLLAGFRERAECPPEHGEAGEDMTIRSCAALAVNPGHDDGWSVTVALPQFDAATPDKLEDALRTKLDAGEHVVLRVIGGRDVELDPERVRQVAARTCTADA